MSDGATVYWIDPAGRLRVDDLPASRLRSGRSYEAEASAAFDWPEHLLAIPYADAGTIWAQLAVARFKLLAIDGGRA